MAHFVWEKCRARTTSIVNSFPASHFWALSCMHGVSPSNDGRRVCVEMRKSSSLPPCRNFVLNGLVAGVPFSIPDRAPSRCWSACARAARFQCWGALTRRAPLAGAPLGGPGALRRGGRSPGTVWCPALMESVDGWPLATPDTKIPGGSRPAVSAVRRRDCGVRTLLPRAVCRREARPPACHSGG